MLLITVIFFMLPENFMPNKNCYKDTLIFYDFYLFVTGTKVDISLPPRLRMCNSLETIPAPVSLRSMEVVPYQPPPLEQTAITDLLGDLQESRKEEEDADTNLDFYS